LPLSKKKRIANPAEIVSEHNSIELLKLSSLVELAETLNQQNDFNEVLRLVVRKAAGLFNADTAMIMMINPQTRQTVKTLQKQGQDGNDQKLGSVQTHVSGWMIKNKQTFFSSDIKSDPRFIKKLF